MEAGSSEVRMKNCWLLSIGDWVRADPPISRAAPDGKSAQIISSEEPRDLSLSRMKGRDSSALSTPGNGNWPRLALKQLGAFHIA
jgi:hypothetical protein